jgi:polysaccharide export outer membrane protein
MNKTLVIALSIMTWVMVGMVSFQEAAAQTPSLSSISPEQFRAIQSLSTQERQQMMLWLGEQAGDTSRPSAQPLDTGDTGIRQDPVQALSPSMIRFIQGLEPKERREVLEHLRRQENRELHGQIEKEQWIAQQLGLDSRQMRLFKALTDKEQNQVSEWLILLRGSEEDLIKYKWGMPGESVNKTDFLSADPGKIQQRGINPQTGKPFELDPSQIDPDQLDQNLLDMKEEVEKPAPLQPFGYDVFAGPAAQFGVATDMAIPDDYPVGAGDYVVLHLFGKENRTLELMIDREGRVSLPGIGPVAVAGMGFGEMRRHLAEKVSQQQIGVEANVTLGRLRSFQIFVMGEVVLPGSYVVSGLSTVTHALFASGGISPRGSLRNIQVRRQGKTVAQMDLYALLLEGDNRHDIRLQSGDVVFVPPIGKTAGVEGEVLRPAIYEIKHEKSVGELIGLAGGLLPTAFGSGARIERVGAGQVRTVSDVNLTVSQREGLGMPLSDGDKLIVPSVLEEFEDVVFLEGAVRREGAREWVKGMRISDALGRELSQDADMRYALLIREHPINQSLSVIQFSPEVVMTAVKTDPDLILQPRDRLHFVNNREERQEQLQDLVQRLIEQRRQGEAAQVVSALGSVRFPGVYPLSEGMTLQGLIDAVYDLQVNADPDFVLLERLSEADRRTPRLMALSLNDPRDRALLLGPQDRILFFDKETPRELILQSLIERIQMSAAYDEPAPVLTISGAVRFPGVYPYVSGVNLKRVIAMAGGLTESAYGLETEITRLTIDEAERSGVKHIPVSMQQDSEIQLQPNDAITFRQKPDWSDRSFVTITGEVVFPGRYPIRKGETLLDLVKRAGGLSDTADPSALVLLRESIREKEKGLIQQYTDQLEKDLATRQLREAAEDTGGANYAAIGQTLLERIRNADPLGRLVVNFPDMLKKQESNLTLVDQDRIIIPPVSQEVTVMGEVNFPSSHQYRDGLDLDSYINVSGGYTPKADKRRAYVIRSSGEVTANTSSGWFVSESLSIGPGDTIVVPYDIDTMSNLAWWMRISQVLYQLATTTAVLNTVGAF